MKSLSTLLLSAVFFTLVLPVQAQQNGEIPTSFREVSSLPDAFGGFRIATGGGGNFLPGLTHFLEGQWMPGPDGSGYFVVTNRFVRGLGSPPACEQGLRVFRTNGTLFGERDVLLDNGRGLPARSGVGRDCSDNLQTPPGTVLPISDDTFMLFLPTPWDAITFSGAGSLGTLSLYRIGSSGIEYLGGSPPLFGGYDSKLFFASQGVALSSVDASRFGLGQTAHTLRAVGIPGFQPRGSSFGSNTLPFETSGVSQPINAVGEFTVVNRGRTLTALDTVVYRVTENGLSEVQILAQGERIIAHGRDMTNDVLWLLYDKPQGSTLTRRPTRLVGYSIGSDGLTEVDGFTIRADDTDFPTVNQLSLGQTFGVAGDTIVLPQRIVTGSGVKRQKTMRIVVVREGDVVASAEVPQVDTDGADDGPQGTVLAPDGSALVLTNHRALHFLVSDIGGITVPQGDGVAGEGPSFNLYFDIVRNYIDLLRELTKPTPTNEDTAGTEPPPIGGPSGEEEPRQLEQKRATPRSSSSSRIDGILRFFESLAE